MYSKYYCYYYYFKYYVCLHALCGGWSIANFKLLNSPVAIICRIFLSDADRSPFTGVAILSIGCPLVWMSYVVLMSLVLLTVIPWCCLVWSNSSRVCRWTQSVLLPIELILEHTTIANTGEDICCLGKMQ